jgi:hypothetical protein
MMVVSIAINNNRHPAEGRGPACGERRIYNCRVAADQTPPFGGVVRKVR